MTTRRIIVGYDRSPDAENAAGWALDEAARTGAPVEFVHANELPPWIAAASMVPAPATWPDAEADRAAKEVLREAVDAAARTHPTVRTSLAVVRNSAALALIGRSAEAGLIVLGCRGHSAVANLLGSVTVAVSAHAHCPVVVVRGTPAPGGPVVVGVDGSEPALDALGFAVEEAVLRGVPLRVIRAWPPVPGLWAESPLVTNTVTARERRPFEELVAGWRGKYPGLRISAEAVVRHPAAALVDASVDAQLLVVGTRGHGTVGGLLLGSVSQHLLRHAACTVVVAHKN